MAEIGPNRMIRYPAGSLVITERFRTMQEADDYPEHSDRDLIEGAAGIAMGMAPALVDGGQGVHDRPDGVVEALVHAAAILTLVADRLILARHAEMEGS